MNKQIDLWFENSLELFLYHYKCGEDIVEASVMLLDREWNAVWLNEWTDDFIEYISWDFLLEKNIFFLNGKKYNKKIEKIEHFKVYETRRTTWRTEELLLLKQFNKNLISNIKKWLN